MKLTGFAFITAIVTALHVAALSVVFGHWHGRYLLAAGASGVVLWGVGPALVPFRRRTGLLLGSALAIAVQQAVFWMWRAKLGGVFWPLAQFAAIHFMLGLAFARWRGRRPPTFVWRGSMLKEHRRSSTHRNK